MTSVLEIKLDMLLVFEKSEIKTRRERTDQRESNGVSDQDTVSSSGSLTKTQVLAS